MRCSWARMSRPLVSSAARARASATRWRSPRTGRPAVGKPRWDLVQPCRAGPPPRGFWTWGAPRRRPVRLCSEGRTRTERPGIRGRRGGAWHGGVWVVGRAPADDEGVELLPLHGVSGLRVRGHPARAESPAVGLGCGDLPACCGSSRALAPGVVRPLTRAGDFSTRSSSLGGCGRAVSLLESTELPDGHGDGPRHDEEADDDVAHVVQLE